MSKKIIFGLVFIGLSGFLIYWFLFHQSAFNGHEPHKPYPYQEEQVSFVDTQAGVTLSGTLTLPKGDGPFPAVVILSGAGSVLRDGYSFAPPHQFLIMADYFTRRGIATLRYDKRGVGNSSGHFEDVTFQDLANDALAGVEFLKGRKEIKSDKIGLVGHSEGGVVGPLAAVHSSDVAFVVMMAGLGIDGEKFLLLHREHLDKAMRLSPWIVAVWQKMMFDVFEEIKKEPDQTLLQKKLDLIADQDLASLKKDDPGTLDQAKAYLYRLSKDFYIFNPWGRFMLSYDPRTTLKELKCPVLVLNGDKDVNVSPDDNLIEIKSALDEGGNKNYEIKLFPDVDHGFVDCKPGNSNAWSDPLEGFSPRVLKYMADWIDERTGVENAK